MSTLYICLSNKNQLIFPKPPPTATLQETTTLLYMIVLFFCMKWYVLIQL